MAALVKLSQILKGRVSSYAVIKQLGDSVWLASNMKGGEKVVVKSVNHWRIQNERDVLRRFQSHTASLRPLLDEFDESSEAPGIVLKYFDDDVLHASSMRRFTTTEIKFVARAVLQALHILHDQGFFHTDVKLNNILVNYSDGGMRFSHACLADFGNVVSEASEYANDGSPIGAPIFRSPEASLGWKWDRTTDIWSFGTTLISLLWGLDFHIFKPDVPVDHDHYALKIMMAHYQFFGPYPPWYLEQADEDTKKVLEFISTAVEDRMKSFHLIREAEISREDKQFILKIMKLDPRDRPTAKELLDDEWFMTLDATEDV